MSHVRLSLLSVVLVTIGAAFAFAGGFLAEFGYLLFLEFFTMIYAIGSFLTPIFGAEIRLGSIESAFGLVIEI